MGDYCSTSDLIIINRGQNITKLVSKEAVDLILELTDGEVVRNDTFDSSEWAVSGKLKYLLDKVTVFDPVVGEQYPFQLPFNFDEPHIRPLLSDREKVHAVNSLLLFKGGRFIVVKSRGSKSDVRAQGYAVYSGESLLMTLSEYKQMKVKDLEFKEVVVVYGK